MEFKVGDRVVGNNDYYFGEDYYSGEARGIITHISDDTIDVLWSNGLRIRHNKNSIGGVYDIRLDLEYIRDDKLKQLGI